ncbi:MAG TPA: hypothetical protein VGK36_10940 [Candidatus Angelobacter sp.]|jgi:predicted  nucleic acid-binding Zn-ribbon protein
MKLKARSYWFALLLPVMFSVPAVAQFEVSPDHFEDSSPSTRQDAHSNSAANLKLQDLKMQIGEQKKLLVSYQGRLLEKSALVAKARHALGDSGSAAARNDLLRKKSELQELRESLASPVRDARLALARLERQQQALRAAARTRDPRSSSAALLSASK